MCGRCVSVECAPIRKPREVLDVCIFVDGTDTRLLRRHISTYAAEAIHAELAALGYDMEDHVVVDAQQRLAGEFPRHMSSFDASQFVTCMIPVFYLAALVKGGSP